MKRKLGRTDIEVTTVALGCWPIAEDVTHCVLLSTLKLSEIELSRCSGGDNKHA